MLKRRGLSDIVATVLIILLAIAAVVIVAGFVNRFIGQAGTSIDLSSQCLNVNVKPTACTSNSVMLQLTGDSSANVKSVVAVVKKADGTSTSELLPAPEFLSTANVTISTSDGDEVTGAAIVQDEEGNVYTCDVSSDKLTCDY